MSIPETYHFSNAIPTIEIVRQCPRCEFEKLNAKIIMTVQFCPNCRTWIRHIEHQSERAGLVSV